MLTLCGVESEIPVQIVKEGKIWPAAASTGLMLDATCGLADNTAENGGWGACADLECVDGVFLANGARIYLDHELYEYATPEAATTMDAVAAVRAGDLIVRRAGARLREATGAHVLAVRNNSDGHGNSYGAHVNVRMSRAGFQRIFNDGHVLSAFVVPFFVTLPILCGGGSIVHGEQGSRYVIWQRARFLKELVGWQTTVDRPLICERDEALSAHPERCARFHVIAFDACRCEVGEYLKLGLLRLLCAAVDVEAIDVDAELQDPLAGIGSVSQQPFAPLRLASGGTATPLEVQEIYLNAFKKLHNRGMFTGRVSDAGAILERWEQTLTTLRREPFDLVGSIDWISKLAWLEGVRGRHGLRWSDPQMRWLDIEYHALVGAEVPSIPFRRVTTDEQVNRLVAEPPIGSRATLRGAIIRRFGQEIEGADWHWLMMAGARYALVLPDEPPPDTADRLGQAETLAEAAVSLDLELKTGKPCATTVVLGCSAVECSIRHGSSGKREDA